MAPAVTLSRGILIAFEGIDGAGKTTQAALLSGALTKAGLAVASSKEPTAGHFGQLIRRTAHSGRLPPREELELFHADRREHVAAFIKPALADREVVIVDRYYFSTAAYQGARGLDPEAILRENESFAPVPDMLVFLDIDAKVAVERIRLRANGSNLFEESASLRRCAEIFRSLQRPYLVRIDGTLAMEVIHARVIQAFDELRLAPPRKLLTPET